jgi:hypothetical protein
VDSPLGIPPILDRVFWGGSRVDSPLGIPPILDQVFWGGSQADSPLFIKIIIKKNDSHVNAEVYHGDKCRACTPTPVG